MKSESIATVYAQALLEVADEQGRLDDVVEEVEAFARILRDEPDIRLFIENPRLERSEKRRVLKAGLEGKVSDLFVDFLSITIDKGRQPFLEEILEAFRGLYDEHIGRLRAEVVSAVEMTGESVDALAAVMSERLGRTVLLSPRVDPEILGGLVVRFDGKVADGSLKNDLDEIGAAMAASKFGSRLVHEDSSGGDHLGPQA